MSTASNSAAFQFIISTGFTVWVVKDSLKRGKLAWGYAIFSFILLWWACLPFYLAGRKLLPGETREGGYGWNAAKYFMLLWSLLIGLCFVGGMMNVSEHLSDRELNDAQTAGAAIGVGLGMGMFFCLWIGVMIPAAIIGLLLKKNTIVEKGDEVTVQQAPAPAQVQVAKPPAPPVAPTPLPPPPVQISVARQGKTIGTYDAFTFGKLVASGEIHATDHYWKQGMAGWELVCNYRP